MSRSATAVLREQGRGITGALLVAGIAFLYTMETWWLGWQLPLAHLLGYALVGLAIVFVVTRSVGFREDGGRRTIRGAVVDFSELVVQSIAAALVVLFALGVLRYDTAPLTVVRLVLVQVVPLGLGAALANALLAETDDAVEARPFPRNIAIFVLGAVFVTIPIAPTQEMLVVASQAGWARHAALIVLSILVVHLVLHELEFRGHTGRVGERSLGHQVGTAFVVYAVGVAVSVGMLAGFQQFAGMGPSAWVQLVVVHAFPASVGASGAEVVL